jgi:HrpA-like RNA helicase
MEKKFITKAQMDQRKGRSGRTKAGFCYKLYTKKDEEHSIDFPEPEIKKVDLKNICLTLLKLGSEIDSKDFNVEKTIKMFTEFIEPPREDYIVDGFDFSYKFNLINSDNKLSGIGQLITETHLDLTDGLTLLYAYNTNYHVFRKVFKIICICSFLKTGPEDLFYLDVNKNTKKQILEQLSADSYNSEHVLLLQIYKYIEETPGTNIFNIELFNQIEQVYQNQVNKLVKIYDKYAINFSNVSKEDAETNIIYSFNYGFKESRAFKSGGIFKFNDLVCNLDKAFFNYEKYASIVFYSNINVNGKLNISIISPYLFVEQ